MNIYRRNLELKPNPLKSLLLSYLTLADLTSWLKAFNLSLEGIRAAVQTLYQLGHSEDIKQTQVG